MISKTDVIFELRTKGYCILKDYFDESFCIQAINEIDNYIKSNNKFVYENAQEDTSGDERLFAFEKVSKTAMVFKNDTFLNSIICDLTDDRASSYFTLGGRLFFEKNKRKNSGGGWHRDSDEEQYKYMLYLNDVTSENGPFLLLKNSKTFDLERRKLNSKLNLLQSLIKFIKNKDLVPPRYTDKIVNDYLKNNKSSLKEFCFSAGTIIIFDSTFIHRGKNIISGKRYTYTNYFFKKNILNKYLINREFKKLYVK